MFFKSSMDETLMGTKLVDKMDLKTNNFSKKKDHIGRSYTVLYGNFKHVWFCKNMFVFQFLYSSFKNPLSVWTVFQSERVIKTFYVVISGMKTQFYKEQIRLDYKYKHYIFFQCLNKWIFAKGSRKKNSVFSGPTT